jgi:hypothetical protein
VNTDQKEASAADGQDRVMRPYRFTISEERTMKPATRRLVIVNDG